MPRLCEFYPGICLTTEKNLSRGKKNLSQGKTNLSQVTKKPQSEYILAKYPHITTPPPQHTHTHTLQNPHIHTHTHTHTCSSVLEFGVQMDCFLYCTTATLVCANDFYEQQGNL